MDTLRESARPATALLSRHADVAFGTDADAVTATERILFDGRLGSQRVRVWLERRGGGIGMLSHDIGPALDRTFGKDEIETFLEIEHRYVPELTAALRAEHPDSDVPGDACELLADRFRDDSAPRATSESGWPSTVFRTGSRSSEETRRQLISPTRLTG
jgi:hypothetical protein